MTNKQAAISIVRRLRQNGHQALLAGGCVRDMLLGRRASDYDVATEAHPEQVAYLFRRTLKVGAKFGVVIVLLQNQKVEVATFRTDTGYADGRHPSHVSFASSAEDAARRDFTINGMFYDPLTRRVIDHVDGQRDLKKRIVRTIGDPADRFAEDYLRMLRAIRFSTKLGFKIHPTTLSAIRRNADRITAISGERIATELEGILVDPGRTAGASLLLETGLADAIFPGYSHNQPKFAIMVLRHLPAKIGFPLALTAFFAAADTDSVLDSCDLLKLSRNQTKHIAFLLTNRSRLLDGDMSLADLKKLLAQPYFWDLYTLQWAIQKSVTGKSALTPLIKLRRRITALGDIDLQPKPLLNGHDLMCLGVTPGPLLGQLIRELYTAQLEGILTTRDHAEKWVLRWLNKHPTRQ
jgi:poly(A) polymerase